MNNNNNCADYSRYPASVGIIAVEMYFPSLYVDQTELEVHDGVSSGKYTIGLGQSKMGFVSDREDTYSMSLTVVKRLLEKSKVSPADVGFMMVGTESPLDKSKSVKTVLMQLFADSGNSDIQGVDTYTACYGGTAALIHAVQWVESSAWDGRLAIVVATDQAMYAKGSGRPTGGAGSVAMLIGPNAPLALERGTLASYMQHAYDFYKPNLASIYNLFDSNETISCYYTALDKCFEGFAKKTAKHDHGKPLNMDDFDGILLHAPYGKLVQKSIGRMVLNQFHQDPSPDYSGRYKGLEPYRDVKLSETFTNRDLEKLLISLSADWYAKKNKPSLLLSNQIGNMYTASVWGCLVAYLVSKPAEELAGKRVAVFSYGSGLASSMFSFRVSSDSRPGTPLANLVAGVQDVTSRLAARIKVSPAEFEAVLDDREATHLVAPHSPTGSVEDLFPGTYYLTEVDGMFRRKYERKPLK